jgi:hypothetical protein
LTLPTYEELKAAAGPNWGLTSAAANEAEKKRQEETRASLERANNIAFQRECIANGVDPSRGVSPSLIKSLADHPVPKGEF